MEVNLKERTFIGLKTIRLREISKKTKKEFTPGSDVLYVFQNIFIKLHEIV